MSFIKMGFYLNIFLSINFHFLTFYFHEHACFIDQRIDCFWRSKFVSHSVWLSMSNIRGFASNHFAAASLLAKKSIFRCFSAVYDQLLMDFSTVSDKVWNWPSTAKTTVEYLAKFAFHVWGWIITYVLVVRGVSLLFLNIFPGYFQFFFHLKFC